MSTLTEIENAISHLPVAEVEKLVGWLEQWRGRRANPPPLEDWLSQSRGAARPGATTAEIMALTRGEE